MKKGDIILVKFPFTDLSTKKLRPALVLASPNKEGDVSLAFISSQLNKRDKFDVTLLPQENDFNQSGLKKGSLVKVNKIITLNKKIVLGKIGSLSQGKKKQVDEKLREFLKL